MSFNEKFIIIIPPQDAAQHPGCLERLADGDHNAYAWIYKNYGKKVYDYAWLMTADAHQSEDIVQEVFFRIWMKREKLKTVADFNAWLFIVTRNYIVNWRRKKKREQCNAEEYRQFMEKGFELGVYCDGENEYETMLAAAVQQLPPQQRVVYQLQKQFKWKRTEIAKALKLSPETIKRHSKIAVGAVIRYCSRYRDGSLYSRQKFLL